MERSCPVKTGSPPAESTARVYGLKTLAPLPKPRADNNACACSDMPALIELTLLGETKCGKNCLARRVTLRSKTLQVRKGLNGVVM